MCSLAVVFFLWQLSFLLFFALLTLLCRTSHISVDEFSLDVRCEKWYVDVKVSE